MAKNEFVCDCNVIHQDIVEKIEGECNKELNYED